MKRSVEHASGRLRRRRMGWGVLDQGVSSMGNLLLGVFVATTMGAADLGALAMVFLVYGVTLNLTRGLSTDPLMVRFSGETDPGWREAAGAATGLAVLMGLASGVVCGIVGASILLLAGSSSLGWALLALGVGLPGLTAQDSWRFAFFSCGKPVLAFVNDGVWTLLWMLALSLLHVLDGVSIGWTVLVFAVTSTLAAMVGSLQAGLVPRWRLARSWLGEHRDLGPRFLVENLTLGIGGQIRSLSVAVIGGLAAAGAIRGAEMLVAPAITVLMGASQVAVPEVVASLRRGAAEFRRLCLAISLGLSGLAVGWGLVVLLLPAWVGTMLLGSVWTDALALLPGVVVAAAAGCLNVGASAGLRALERADRTMRAQLVVTVLGIVACVAGGVGWGAQGAVWGKALAAVTGAAIWWRFWQVANRERDVARIRLSAPPPARVQAPAVDPPAIDGGTSRAAARGA